MTTELKMGMKVYTDMRTGGESGKNWWDLDGLVKKGCASYGPDAIKYFQYILTKRLGYNEKAAKEKIAELKVTRNYYSPAACSFLINSLEKVTPELISNASAVVNRLKRKKSMGKVDHLIDLFSSAATDHDLVTAMKNAIKCTEHGCESYRKAIMTLLENRPDTSIVAKFTPKLQRADFGQTGRPERIKFYCKNIATLPRIFAWFGSREYCKKTDVCARHVEILSGILFEAGNVYAGVYLLPAKTNSEKKQQHDAEAEVWVHNAGQIMGIARNKYPITQNDWRNVMALLLASDVDLGLFVFTGRARRSFSWGHHDVSAENLTA